MLDHVTVLLLLSLSLFVVYGKQPRVTVENGVVVGKYLTSFYGSRYRAFEGIPYAKPPVDKRRFKDPEPIQGPWIGEWNATQPGSKCMQFDQFTKEKDKNGHWAYQVVGDEDCLYLNVYSQEGSSDKNVIVTIHGGVFVMGSGGSLGPDYLMHLNDIVLVTFNYRLGPLGFLSTGDAASPGNYGLKDQKLALEWVQRNIRSFGGDPKKVTLFGASAGGASVHYHYLSEKSTGLFQKGYSLGGTALNPWAFDRNGPEKTRRLASYLGCPTTDSKLMVKCIRRRPARKIVQQVERFKVWLYNPANVFGPVVDVHSPNPFLKDEPRNLLKQGKVQDLPWITSYASHEGLYPGGEFIDNEKFMEELDQRWDEILPAILSYEEPSRKGISPKSKEIRDHYLGTRKITRDTVYDVIQMISDLFFISSIAEAAVLQAQVNTEPVHIYKYEHAGSVSLTMAMTGNDKIFGAAHVDDFLYMFKLNNLNSHIKESDKEMAGILLKILHHFAINGSSPAPFDWQPVSREPGSKLNYLHLKSPQHVKMEQCEDAGNFKFFEKLFYTGSSLKKEEL